MPIPDQIDQPALRGSGSRRYERFWTPGGRTATPLTQSQSPLDAMPELLRHKARLEKAGYKATTIATLVTTTQHFLHYLESRKLTLEEVGLVDLTEFLSMRLKAFEERYARLPKNPSAWQSDCVGPVHQFLRMVHPHWPPDIPPSVISVL